MEHDLNGNNETEGLDKDNFLDVHLILQVNHINTLSFALKVENRSAEIKNLKMEAVVLAAVKSLRSPFFCRVFFCGRAERFNFIIMTLVGKNLNVWADKITADNPGFRSYVPTVPTSDSREVVEFRWAFRC